MAVSIVCPHCEYDFQVTTLLPDGSILCGICTKSFPPTPEQAVLLAEVTRLAAEESIPVAEVIGRPPSATPTASTGWEGIGGTTGSPRALKRTTSRLPDEDDDWAAFAHGSRIVCFGIMTELIAFTILLVVQLIFGAMTAERGPQKSVTSPMGFIHQAFTALSLVGIVIGSGMVAAGRTEQAKIPPDRMGTGSFVTVSLVSWVGVVGCVLAMLVIIAGFLDGSPSRIGATKMVTSMMLGVLVACICRWSADAGTIINLGLVSGIMPSRPLRDRVAAVNVAGQLMTLCYLGLFALTYFKVLELPLPRGNSGDGLITGVMVGLASYLIFFIYEMLQLTLNAVAGEEARLWKSGRVE